MCTINRSGRRPYGCPVPVGSGVCGETKTLDIINEFKRLYEEKMHEIDNSSCGDCLQEKIKLQQDWIGDLTEQNEMLVRAVEELEQEATERVKMLEEKLQRSAQCICEADQKNKGLDSTIQCLESKVGECERISRELKVKKEECEKLQKNMIDMRQALTEEVATKHDAILKLKRECQDLEDRCIQADKQTAFRDDIIKELRKEIKQLKQQMSFPEKPYPKIPQSSDSSDTLRREVDGEHVLIVNHTKKIVQSGKSTVIYLRHDAEEKLEKSETVVNEHIAHCSKCRLKFENNSGKNNATRVEDKKENERTLFLCKSENDLSSSGTLLSHIKERSKMTVSNAVVSRRNTFVGTSKQSEDENKNVCVPKHIPVRMYVNNLEFNKKKYDN